jgi:glycosyltransferase involved in cell wall biosynthesis
MFVAADRIVPGPTYSGNAVVRWSLLQGLRGCGMDMAYYSASPSDPEHSYFDGSELKAVFGAQNVWLDRPGYKVARASISALQSAVDDFKPDVILAFGLRSLALIRATHYTGQVGLYSIDLEHLVPLYWARHYILHGTALQKLNALRRLPKTFFRSWKLRRATLREYPKASFVINSAAHHAAWHAERHGRPTLYVPNPVEPLFSERPAHTPSTPPRFLLLGGLAGIATTTGLVWFSRQVYPHLEDAIADGRIEVHLAGRLASRRNFHQMHRVIHRGYIDDLAGELRQATAVLVPTPINLGFRTRILDAFRHGVTVVAHTANSSGMPELVDGKNALLAANGRDFAEAILRLADDPEEAQRLGRTAFDQFSKEMNAVIGAKRICDFIHACSNSPTAVIEPDRASPAAQLSAPRQRTSTMTSVLF